MRKIKPVIVILFIAIILVSIINLGVHPLVSSLTKEEMYREHSPIKIDRNKDFDFVHGVVGGSGTYQDPYIIKGWKIDANRTEYGILIENTSAYVIVEDCYIYNTSHTTEKDVSVGFRDFSDNDGGIEIIKSSNVGINNVVLEHSDSGIFIYGCGNIWIENSHFNAHLYTSVYVKSSWWISIEENTFSQNSGKILLRNSEHVTVEKNTFTRYGDDGIDAENAEDLKIANNNILGEKRYYTTGITVSSSKDVDVENNTIDDMGTGMEIKSSTNSKVANNSMVNCSVVVGGNKSEVSTYFFRDNKVNHREMIFIKNRQNFTFSGYAGEIILANVSNFKVTHANISHVSCAIEVVHGNNGTVENNELPYNLKSIIISASENITVADNNMAHDTWGISISSSKYILVENNSCEYFKSGGISISSSNFVKIQNNKIYHTSYAISFGGVFNRNIYIMNNTCDENYFGLYLSDSRDVIVEHNHFNKNHGSGITIDGVVKDLKISENICNDNEWYGIDVSGWLEDSEITNNTLVGNKEGLHIPRWATPENCTISGNKINDRIPTTDYILVGFAIAVILIVAVIVFHFRRKKS